MSDPIFGYLDPGSGSMILQMILGGAAGLIVALKMFGRRLFETLFFWRRREPTSAEKAAAESGTDA